MRQLINEIRFALLRHLVVPERWLNSEFVDGLNEAANIVAQNLAEDFIYLRRFALAPQAFAEHRFNYAEWRLHVWAALFDSYLFDNNSEANPRVDMRRGSDVRRTIIACLPLTVGV